jgi:branched-chain amino acid transport system substrate-binding protein
MRMQLLIEALAQALGAINQAPGALDMAAVGLQLERATVSLNGQSGAMRSADHQFQQPLVVGQMDRVGTSGIKFDVEGSGFGFRVIKALSPAAAEQPTTCKMVRP